MKIAFLANKLTLRGSEVNLYNYADANETILGNESIIITRPYEMVLKISPQDVHPEAYSYFQKRFKVFYYVNPEDVETIIQDKKIDVIFIEKGGRNNDGLNFKSCKTFIHAIFNTNEPHGDMYTAISQELNDQFKTNVPVLPNIVKVHPSTDDLKKELDIPEDSIVFGGYGGEDSFNVDYVKRAVIAVSLAERYSNIYFIFLNFTPFGQQNRRLKFLPGTTNTEYKRRFINTCNAMIYGRNLGETFGISCGEFSICNKPVIASLNPSHDYAHIKILGDNIVGHTTYEELFSILTHWNVYDRDVSNNRYYDFSEKNVMQMFDSLLKRIS